MKIYNWKIIEFTNAIYGGGHLYMPIIQTNLILDTMPPNGRKTPPWGWKLDKTLFPKCRYTKYELFEALGNIKKGFPSGEVFESRNGDYYSYEEIADIFMEELIYAKPVESFNGELLIRTMKDMRSTLTKVDDSRTALDIGVLLRDADMITLTMGREYTFSGAQIEVLTLPYYVMAIDVAPGKVEYMGNVSCETFLETRASVFNALQVTDEEGIQLLEKIAANNWTDGYEVKTIPGMDWEDAKDYLHKNHI